MWWTPPSPNKDKCSPFHSMQDNGISCGVFILQLFISSNIHFLMRGLFLEISDRFSCRDNESVERRRLIRFIARNGIVSRLVVHQCCLRQAKNRSKLFGGKSWRLTLKIGKFNFFRWNRDACTFTSSWRAMTCQYLAVHTSDISN